MSLAGGVMGQIGAGLLGRHSRAILIISDKRRPPKEQPAPSEKLTPNPAAVGLASTVNLKALAGMSGTEKLFQVQFNPNSLTLHAAGKPVQIKTVESKKDAPIQESVSVVPSRATLRVQLIFDDLIIPDAFMADRLSLNPRDIAEVVKWKLGRSRSVRAEIEGLVAAIQSPQTREMTFCWSKFMFKGTMNSINATYTMFNTKGEPIRGTVDMRLEQTVEAKMLHNWREDFTEMFGPAGRMDARGGSGVFKKYLG